MASRVSTLTEKGDISAAAGTREWSIAVRNNLVSLIQEDANEAGRMRDLLTMLKKHEGYRHLTDAKRRPFTSWVDFCKHKLPLGLGYDSGIIDRVIEESRTPKVVAAEMARDAKVEPLRDVGRPKGEDGNVDNVNITGGGNRAEYLVKRLKRDAPEIAKALADGEYPSARSAGIAAGIVKVPTPEEAAIKAIAKADKLLVVRSLLDGCSHAELVVIQGMIQAKMEEPKP